MQRLAIYASVALSIMVAGSCSDQSREGGGSSQPPLAQPAGGGPEPVALYASMSFGEEEQFHPLAEVAVVNVGTAPVRLDGTPGMSVEISYWNYARMQRYGRPSDPEGDPPELQEKWRFFHSGNGSYGRGPHGDLVKGTLELQPGQCALFRYDFGKYRGRSADWVRIDVGTTCFKPDGAKVVVEREFAFAVPYRPPPHGMDSWPPTQPMEEGVVLYSYMSFKGEDGQFIPCGEVAVINVGTEFVKLQGVSPVSIEPRYYNYAAFKYTIPPDLDPDVEPRLQKRYYLPWGGGYKAGLPGRLVVGTLELQPGQCAVFRYDFGKYPGRSPDIVKIRAWAVWPNGDLLGTMRDFAFAVPWIESLDRPAWDKGG